MVIKYSTTKNLNSKEINELRESIEWTSKRNWKEIISKSFLVVTAWDKNILVGMGRLVEDGVFCVLYDFVVRKEYQGKGIGNQIMKKMLEKIKHKNYRGVYLFANDELDYIIPFYSKFGFKLVKNGMKLE